MAKDFKQMQDLKPVLMIVDSLNLAFRWKHKGSRDFLEEYVKTIESLKKSYGAKWVVIASDLGSSSYRKEIYPDYKQNRKDAYAEQTEAEAEYFQAFFQEFNNVLDYFESETPYPVLRFNKVEADDIAAYIVKTVNNYSDVKEVVLISSDRDWDLLIQPNVMRFSYVTTKEITWDSWSEHYEYPPDKHISIKCLQGDSGDNVLGVKGVGPKKALELVNKYGSAMDIAGELPITSKYKYIQNLNEFGAEGILLNYRLMDLVEFSEEAVGIENCQHINNILTEYLNAN